MSSSLAICDVYYIYTHAHKHTHNFISFTFIISIFHANTRYGREGKNGESKATCFMNGKFSLWQQRVWTILRSEKCRVHRWRAEKYLAAVNFSSETETHNQYTQNTQNDQVCNVLSLPELPDIFEHSSYSVIISHILCLTFSKRKPENLQSQTSCVRGRACY